MLGEHACKNMLHEYTHLHELGIQKLHHYMNIHMGSLTVGSVDSQRLFSVLSFHPVYTTESLHSSTC